MRQFRIWALLAGFPTLVQAEHPLTSMLRGDAAYRSKDYAKCAELYTAAGTGGLAGSGAAYNAACCHALNHQPDRAFVALEKAIIAGWRDVEQLKTDSDFDSLRGDPRWKQIVTRCEEETRAFIHSLREPGLRKELIERQRAYEHRRETAGYDIGECKKIDAESTAYMKAVIEKYGWPELRMVGQDGAIAAFQLVFVRHADHDFLKKCLQLLTEAVRRNEGIPQDMALLTDRVLVEEGKPQRYGHQLHIVNGKWQPLPVEDEANMDARRKSVGLPPMAEYLKLMDELGG